MPFLSYTAPGKTTRVFELHDGQLLGEGEDCPLCLGDASPSRYLARVRLEGEHAWLEVLLPGSLRVGTFQDELLDLEEGVGVEVEPLHGVLNFHRESPVATPRGQADLTSPPPPRLSPALAFKTQPSSAAQSSAAQSSAAQSSAAHSSGAHSSGAHSSGVQSSAAQSSGVQSSAAHPSGWSEQPSFILGEPGEVTLPVPPGCLPTTYDEEQELTSQPPRIPVQRPPQPAPLVGEEVSTQLSLRRTDPMPAPVPPTLFIPSARAASAELAPPQASFNEPAELTHVMEPTQLSLRLWSELELDDERPGEQTPTDARPNEALQAAPLEQPAPTPKPEGPLSASHSPEHTPRRHPKTNIPRNVVLPRPKQETPTATQARQLSSPGWVQTPASDNIPVQKHERFVHSSQPNVSGPVPLTRPPQELIAMATLPSPSATSGHQAVVGSDGGRPDWLPWLTRLLWGLTIVLMGAVILALLERR